MPEVRDHIRLPEGLGKHDYLLSLEAPMISGLIASGMQYDYEVWTDGSFLEETWMQTYFF